MRRRGTVALVESATQLLNVIEWAKAANPHDLRVVVLAPKHPNTRRQLGRVGRLADAAGVRVDTIELRRLSGAVLHDGTRLVRDLARAHRIVVGDPFSGLMQSVLPFARPDEIVVVDDGTATWEFRECIDAGRPLLRWRSDRQYSARAAHATRLMSPGADLELTVFSCLSGATPVGAFGIVNDYAWTRADSVPEVRTGGIDVIGASLAETGVVKHEDYASAVAALARRHTSVRYLAHRRETMVGLAGIAAQPGVRVVRPEVPVELALRHGPVADHVIVFPSTAAHTLPSVLSGLPILLEVHSVRPSWFTATATPHIRRFVQRIAEDAPLHVLDAA